MVTYQPQINDTMPLGKGAATLLQSVPKVATVEKTKKEARKSKLYHDLDRAFAEVRLMLDGKMRKKTAQELLDELRQELRNEA